MTIALGRGNFGVWFAAWTLVAAPITPAADGPTLPTPAVARYAALVREYDDAAAAHVRAVAAARTDDERRAAAKLRHGPEEFTHLFLGIAREHPKDPAAVDALVWIVAHDPNGPEGDEALRVLPRDHVASDKLGPACVGAARMTREVAEQFLRAVAAKSPHRAVRGRATYGLARLLQRWADTAPLLEPADRADARQWAEYLGASVTGRIRKDAAGLSAEAARLFERAKADYGEVVYDPSAEAARDRLTLAEGAERARHEVRELTVGRPAPELSGDDLDGRPMRLSDFRGRVVVVSFWATWCPPCMQLIPHERALAARLAGGPFTMLGVNGDDDRAAAAATATKAGATWRSWWDGGREGKVAAGWNVNAWPTVYVIDQAGVIRHKWVGAPDPTALGEAVDALLKAGAR